MNEKLTSALLAMDSYNRDYLNGVEITGDYLGSISLLKVNIDGELKVFDSSMLVNANGARTDITAGFYAIAYQYVDAGVTKTVISYRGTDQFLTANGIGGDIINAYGVGANAADTAQSRALA